jgi:hypothetical protein
MFNEADRQSVYQGIDCFVPTAYVEPQWSGLAVTWLERVVAQSARLRSVTFVGKSRNDIVHGVIARNPLFWDDEAIYPEGDGTHANRLSQ